ncbi:MAG: ROK family protein [Anaerolineae bacterium]
MNASPIYAGIEGGGTKYVCALSDGRSPELIARVSFPTLNNPEATLGACVAWLRNQQAAHGRIAAVGVGSFGPIDLDKKSPTYGRITTTPKPGWQDADVAGAFASELKVPVGFDTDVNVAALGEREWGAGRGLNNLVYITIGTGIGGGALLNGEPIHGLLHPEMGHIRVCRNPAEDPFEGICPVHGDCWEGLCSGPAIEKRCGAPAQDLSPDNPVWGKVAHYTSVALTNIIFTLSPERIILGGSVPKGGQLGRDKFMAMVRAETTKALNGYLKVPALLEHMDEYIVPPGLGDNAGVCGAIVLAMRAERGA